ncbi:hypothetical protein SLA2020_161050 [Shorea laevis]
MLQRSSSSPVLGTLLTSLSDYLDQCIKKHTPHLRNHQHPIKPRFYNALHRLNLTPFSSASSLISASASGCTGSNQELGEFSIKGISRSWSDGDLQGLAAYGSFDVAQVFDSSPQKELLCENQGTMLHSAPSFSIFTEGLEDGDKDGREDAVREGVIERTVTIEESTEAVGSDGFSIGKRKGMGLIEEGEEEEEGFSIIQNADIEPTVEPLSPPMYLATGLGIDAFDGVGFEGDCVDLSSINLIDGGDPEELYKRLVDEFPCHPLFLRNYAQLLQSKGDLSGAEDYYHRATLADPDDGEILSQYAKLVWECHRDKDKALSYFESAVQASPGDSNVLAAYASFLWEIEDDGEEDKANEEYLEANEQESVSFSKNSTHQEETEPDTLSLHLSDLSSLRAHDPDEYTAADISLDVNMEDYYRNMVKQNPNNPLILRNYARFLCKSKGDLQGAEEHYSQAILADPNDGEIMSEYAKLVWELHHNHDKALSYFERAVQATPKNSDVLAAYASFLWETEEDEEDNTKQDQTHVSISHEAGTTATT